MIHPTSSHHATQLPATTKRVGVGHGQAPDPAQQRELQQLRARDREVRQHERAHQAAAGDLARGGASFQTVRGPDGRSYATGGEVTIDTSRVSGDPQATIEKAERIRRAALAPATPSAQDRAVAARATAMAVEAQIELQREQRDAAERSDTESDSAKLQHCERCGGLHAPGTHESADTFALVSALSP